MSRVSSDTILVKYWGPKRQEIEGTPATPQEILDLVKKRLPRMVLVQAIVSYGYELHSFTGPTVNTGLITFILQKF